MTNYEKITNMNIDKLAIFIKTLTIMPFPDGFTVQDIKEYLEEQEDV